VLNLSLREERDFSVILVEVIPLRHIRRTHITFIAETVVEAQKLVFLGCFILNRFILWFLGLIDLVV